MAPEVDRARVAHVVVAAILYSVISARVDLGRPHRSDHAKHGNGDDCRNSRHFYSQSEDYKKFECMSWLSADSYIHANFVYDLCLC